MVPPKIVINFLVLTIFLAEIVVNLFLKYTFLMTRLSKELAIRTLNNNNNNNSNNK